MPRTYSSIDKIRAELAWVNETPDPKQMRLSQSPALRGNWTPARSLLRHCRNEVLDVS